QAPTRQPTEKTIQLTKRSNQSPSIAPSSQSETPVGEGQHPSIGSERIATRNARLLKTRPYPRHSRVSQLGDSCGYSMANASGIGAFSALLGFDALLVAGSILCPRHSTTIHYE